MYYYMDMPFESEQIAQSTFGSIKMYYVGEPYQGANVKLRGYVLLSADAGKLDYITNAAEGSQAIIADTGETYILCNNEWIKWTGSSGGGGGTGAGVTIKWSQL
jgi:hypothetical protein